MQLQSFKWVVAQLHAVNYLKIEMITSYPVNILRQVKSNPLFILAQLKLTVIYTFTRDKTAITWICCLARDALWAPRPRVVVEALSRTREDIVPNPFSLWVSFAAETMSNMSSSLSLNSCLMATGDSTAPFCSGADLRKPDKTSITKYELVSRMCEQVSRTFSNEEYSKMLSKFVLNFKYAVLYTYYTEKFTMKIL